MVLVKKQFNSTDIEISKGMIFLPDDLKKLKVKGKWLLYIKKGALINLEKKQKKK
jgi:hypothetical protein